MRCLRRLPISVAGARLAMALRMSPAAESVMVITTTKRFRKEAVKMKGPCFYQ